jgi:hypothetical protein
MSKKVGDVVIHDFFKNKQMPNKETEKLADIVKIPFIPGHFDNAEDEKIYKQLT